MQLGSSQRAHLEDLLHREAVLSCVSGLSDCVGRRLEFLAGEKYRTDL